MYTRACTHTHTHIHARVHTHTHIHTRARAHTRERARPHTHTCKHTRAAVPYRSKAGYIVGAITHTGRATHTLTLSRYVPACGLVHTVRHSQYDSAYPCVAKYHYLHNAHFSMRSKSSLDRAHGLSDHTGTNHFTLHEGVRRMNPTCERCCPL